MEKVHPILILAVVCLQVVSWKVHSILILAVVCLQVVSWKVHSILVLAGVCLQVVSEVRSVNNQLLPPEPFDDDVSLLFVVAIVMPCVLVLLLALILMGFMIRSCREGSLRPDSADVVPTKYQVRYAGHCSRDRRRRRRMDILVVSAMSTLPRTIATRGVHFVTSSALPLVNYISHMVKTFIMRNF